MIIAGGIIGGYSAKGVRASGDYLTRSGVAGLSDSKTGLLSFWMRRSSSTGLFIAYDGRFRIYGSSPYIEVIGMNSSGNLCLSLESTISSAPDVWYHALAAWDTSNASKCKMYVNGVDRTHLDTISNSNIDYGNYGQFQICGAGSSASYTGDLAEFYFTTAWADITDSSLRDRFSKNGRPVSLGPNGSKPTGTAPLIYLQGPASNWGVNAGTGGDFSVSGSFSDASTKPKY